MSCQLAGKVSLNCISILPKFYCCLVGPGGSAIYLLTGYPVRAGKY